MKAKLCMIVVLSVVTIVATAQTFKTGADQQVMQSQPIMATGNAYNGTVYKPFDNTTPAEYNPIVGDSPAQGPSRAKKFDTGGDTPPGPSPIGDAVLPMLLCAALFCGFIAFRRKRSALNG